MTNRCDVVKSIIASAGCSQPDAKTDKKAKGKESLQKNIFHNVVISAVEYGLPPIKPSWQSLNQ